MTWKLPVPIGYTTSCRFARPMSTVVKPTEPSMFRYLATVERRRSASISGATLSPPSAIVLAKLIDVVDLPSPAIDDVTTKELFWVPLATSRKRRLVRSLRYASARSECGSVNITKGCSAASGSKGILAITE